MHIARGEYTGEDGFEISIPSRHCTEIASVILERGKRQISDGETEVELVGLAARDSLRLEAGMCLYGHDLNEEVDPVEAGLTWVIGTFRSIFQQTRRPSYNDFIFYRGRSETPSGVPRSSFYFRCDGC